jgi:RNA polymerase sigma-70 factor (ECF subfamily)
MDRNRTDRSDRSDRATLMADMLRLCDGDRSAASSVFGRLWPPCLRLAQGALRHDADANDAAQRAMVRLFQDVARFDPDRSPLGWALALTTWECRTIRQAQRRRRVDGAVDAAEHTAADVAIDVALERAADVAALIDGFVTLHPDDQHTLRAMLDGDAAGPPAARKRRSRAIARLRALVLGPVPGDDHV